MEWYNQAGTPHVTAKGVYDAAAKTYEADALAIDPAHAGQSDKKPAIIPLNVGFVSDDGAILAAKREGETVAREQHQIVFDQKEARVALRRRRAQTNRRHRARVRGACDRAR